MTASDLLTFRQAAERLTERLGEPWRVSDIYRSVRAERIPVVAVGRRRLIPAGWVDDPQSWRAS